MEYNYECNSCYIIRLKPDPDAPKPEELAPPGSGMLDTTIWETAMRLEGVIFIDKNGLYVRRFEARLKRGFNKAWGFGRVRKTQLIFEQEQRADLNGVVVIKRAEIFLQVRILFFNTTRRRIWEYHGYELNDTATP